MTAGSHLKQPSQPQLLFHASFSQTQPRFLVRSGAIISRWTKSALLAPMPRRTAMVRVIQAAVARRERHGSFRSRCKCVNRHCCACTSKNVCDASWQQAHSCSCPQSNDRSMIGAVAGDSRTNNSSIALRCRRAPRVGRSRNLQAMERGLRVKASKGKKSVKVLRRKCSSRWNKETRIQKMQDSWFKWRQLS